LSSFIVGKDQKIKSVIFNNLSSWVWKRLVSMSTTSRKQRIATLLQSEPKRLEHATQQCYTSLFVLLSLPIFAFLLHCYFHLNTNDSSLLFNKTTMGSGEMFDIIADNYDITNRLLTFRFDLSWRRLLVSKVKTYINEAVLETPLFLDVATGTADVAILLAESFPNAKIIGIDPSVKMLETGLNKIKTFFPPNYSKQIELENGDIRDLPMSISNLSFDGVTISFGIRNIPSIDRKKALCSIYSVLKPTSVFGILEFSDPEKSDGIIGSIASFFIKNIVPIIGGLLSKHPQAYHYLQQSIEEFPSSSEFQTLLETLSCTNVDGKTNKNKKESSSTSLGAFKVIEVINLNFGSVKIYIVKKGESDK
jgi:demethylmenaquinone methyltransferase / 2-methoxy-6-polyprenyl-1,4-benzoquinol methylase